MFIKKKNFVKKNNIERVIDDSRKVVTFGAEQVIRLNHKYVYKNIKCNFHVDFQ